MTSEELQETIQNFKALQQEIKENNIPKEEYEPILEESLNEYFSTIDLIHSVLFDTNEVDISEVEKFEILQAIEKNNEIDEVQDGEFDSLRTSYNLMKAIDKDLDIDIFGNFFMTIFDGKGLEIMKKLSPKRTEAIIDIINEF